MLDEGTAQGKAYRWLVSRDLAQLCPLDDNMYQRYTLAVLYYETDERQTWTSCYVGDPGCGSAGSAFAGSEAYLSSASECRWAGVTCSNDVVVLLNIPSNGLGGIIPPEISLGLSGIELMNLNGNEIGGTVPALPKVLTDLNLSGNRLSGTLDDIIRGSTMIR